VDMVSYPGRIYFSQTDTVEDSVLVGCDAVIGLGVPDILRVHNAFIFMG